MKQLKGFEKIELAPGETKTVEFNVPLRDITFWNNFYHKMAIEPGEYVAAIGPDSASLDLKEHFTIVGEWDAPLSTVYVDLDKYVYEIGETGKMKVVATLEDTQRIDLLKNRQVYSSSDEKVAKVDADGNVTAAGSGVATITAEVTYQGGTKRRSRPVAVK